MMKKMKPNWRETDDLYKVGARCDAWRTFFKSETIAKLKKIKGRVIWFNRYEYFDKLICEFDCSEKKLRAVIKSLIIPGREMPIMFVRKDIYDARAWAYLPLSCFAEINGCNERSDKNHWQYDILKSNEMPVIQFGLKKKWVVDMGCFKIKHRLKDGMRFAVMTFEHSQLDSRFDGKRWVAEQMFPRETTKEEMTEALFAKVKAECVKHIVTIKQ